MHDGHKTFRQLIGLITDFLHRSLGGDTDRSPFSSARLASREEVRRNEPVDEPRP
jgi:hypothetical protein